MSALSPISCLAWLSTSGLSPECLREVLEEEPDPVRVYHRFPETGEIASSFSLPASVRKTLRTNGTDQKMAWWDRLTAKHHISVMTCADSMYPERLKPFSDAPVILFYRGDPNAARKDAAVSVVGSRNASARGLENTRKIAEDLSRCGIRIISGLAYGIDAAAHQGCLRGGSETVAVLGCGLDQDYPAENAALKEEILAKGGLLLSEFAPGEKPLGWHFPYRNRIISALGDCLVLMEARIRSGSMTTVQHALNQGRDVFVHPGEPGTLRSEGNHQLLREGAIYFTDASDLMEDMHWLDKRRDVGQNNERPAEAPMRLSREEQMVLNRLDAGALSFDQLCDGLNMSAAQLNAVISMLQIQGAIRALPGKMYQKKQEC